MVKKGVLLALTCTRADILAQLGGLDVVRSAKVLAAHIEKAPSLSSMEAESCYIIVRPQVRLLTHAGFSGLSEMLTPVDT